MIKKIPNTLLFSDAKDCFGLNFLTIYQLYIPYYRRIPKLTASPTEHNGFPKVTLIFVFSTKALDTM